MRVDAGAVSAAALTVAAVAEHLLLGASPMDAGCAVAKALLHNLVHANWLHLAANVLCAWLLLPGRRVDVHAGLLLGSLAWLLCSPFLDVVPIGLSDAMLATAGRRVARNRRGGWWRGRWLPTVAAAVALQALVPGVSALTHAVSLALGLLAGTLRSAMDENERTYGQVAGGRGDGGRERKEIR